MTNDEAIDILQNIKMIYLGSCLSLARGNGKSFMELERFLKTMQAFDMAIDALNPITKRR